MIIELDFTDDDALEFEAAMRAAMTRASRRSDAVLLRYALGEIERAIDEDIERKRMAGRFHQTEEEE